MAEIGIFVGTMYGNSLLVAEEAEAILTATNSELPYIVPTKIPISAIGLSPWIKNLSLHPGLLAH